MKNLVLSGVPHVLICSSSVEASEVLALSNFAKHSVHASSSGGVQVSFFLLYSDFVGLKRQLTQVHMRRLDELTDVDVVVFLGGASKDVEYAIAKMRKNPRMKQPYCISCSVSGCLGTVEATRTFSFKNVGGDCAHVCFVQLCVHQCVLLFTEFIGAD